MNDELRSCANKNAYKLWTEAHKALVWALRNGTVDNPKTFHVYTCDYCGHFHLGHSEKWSRLNANRRPKIKEDVNDE